jgi:nicotinate-nucleotide pyrophosphorylase (carboxylating)
MLGCSNAMLNDIIDEALEEDISQGDITTALLIDPREEGTAKVIAGGDLVLAGREIFEKTMNRVDAYLSVNHRFNDGSGVPGGGVIMTVTGPVVSILTAERTALNFLSHMCGIATMTRKYVDAIPPGMKTRITDTRKTLPGLRRIEKYSVACGGGVNHRANLSSGILIKDNHLAVCGSVAKAVSAARKALDPSHRIEVEVASLDEVNEALSSGAEVIMLDNMGIDEVIAAVQRIAGRALVEVSGNVTPERIPDLARAGIDFISVGAITHSAPACDISLEIDATHEQT